MIAKNKIKNNFKLSDEDSKREKRIINKLNLKKLPYKISSDNFCNFVLDMVRHSSSVFKYQEYRPGVKWCFSTIKRLKVFLIIFEANEEGYEIYKEKIYGKVPEYSYKTIAQIVDEGIAKGFFLKLSPRLRKIKDLKIRNIRPSEDLIVEFLNWKIDLLSSLIMFQKKYK